MKDNWVFISGAIPQNERYELWSGHILSFLLLHGGALYHCNAIGLFSSIQVTSHGCSKFNRFILTISLLSSGSSLYTSFNLMQAIPTGREMGGSNRFRPVLSWQRSGRKEDGRFRLWKTSIHFFRCMYYTANRTMLGREEWIGDALVFKGMTPH